MYLFPNIAAGLSILSKHLLNTSNLATLVSLVLLLFFYFSANSTRFRGSFSIPGFESSVKGS